MTGFITALFLLGPSLAVKTSVAEESRCYMMRILPVPKDFHDSMGLQAGKAAANLEEVRPNCWAQPSTAYLSKPKAWPKLPNGIPTEKR